MHCNGCEKKLSMDYNICVGCHGKGLYKEFAQMHPSNERKNSNVNHTDSDAHRSFTMHMRFATMDEALSLRDRVRKLVGRTYAMPGMLSQDFVDSDESDVHLPSDLSLQDNLCERKGDGNE